MKLTRYFHNCCCGNYRSDRELLFRVLSFATVFAGSRIRRKEPQGSVWQQRVSGVRWLLSILRFYDEFAVSEPLIAERVLGTSLRTSFGRPLGVRYERRLRVRSVRMFLALFFVSLQNFFWRFFRWGVIVLIIVSCVVNVFVERRWKVGPQDLINVYCDTTVEVDRKTFAGCTRKNIRGILGN